MTSVDLLHVAYGGLGGHVSVVSTLSKELTAIGITSGVLAVASGQAIADSSASWAHVEFVEPVRVRRRGDLTSMGDAYRLGKRIEARVVLMHTLRHTTPVALGRIASGQRLNFITRESYGLPSRTPIVNLQSASSVAWGQAVVFLTRENMLGYPLRRLPLRGLRNRVVIPNGVDLSRFEGAAGAESAKARVAVLGMAARFVPGKDFETLIRGLALLRDDLGESCPRVLLAGDGANRDAIDALVDELGLRDRVTFLGQLPEAEIPAFLSSLDAYVQLTDGEAFSMSLIQACAARRPVISSDVPGVQDVFTDRETALLIPPRDARAFADAVIELLQPAGSLAADLAENGHRMAVDEYSSARMAQSYVELFGTVDPSGPWTAARQRLIEGR